jgi:hypothetical protein
MAKTTHEEGLQAQAGPAVPNIVCEVLPGNTVVHGGKHHEPGDQFEVEGPTAIALVQAGHVSIVGSVHP